MSGKRRAPSLVERIDKAIAAAGGKITFYELANQLYPSSASHRNQVNGGPPGCYITLSMWVRRGGFPESWKEPGPGNRIVYARPIRALNAPANSAKTVGT